MTWAGLPCMGRSTHALYGVMRMPAEEPGTPLGDASRLTESLGSAAEQEGSVRLRTQQAATQTGSQPGIMACMPVGRKGKMAHVQHMTNAGEPP